MGIIAEKLGKRIKELRERKNLSQQQLSDIMDMEASNLSKIERGVQIPKEESLIKLAKALEVSIVDLFDYEHYTDRTMLLKNINKILTDSDEKTLQKIYKILINL
ncbi:MAG: helix-turn-helix domain-containing protein [bacterium]|nr:helix-turn-helix domain-containing protein [bacterium]